MAHCHVTPVHRDPSDPRAPQQVEILRDGKDCSLVCERVKYKHKQTNTNGCYTGMDVKIITYRNSVWEQRCSNMPSAHPNADGTGGVCSLVENSLTVNKQVMPGSSPLHQEQ